MDPRTRLLRSLLVEVFQAERSGVEHPRREAMRLGDTPPAYAMAAISDDCVRALEELRIAAPFARETGGLGERIGHALSVVRERATDLVATRELSYRATLLGVQHGMDAIALLRAAADEAADGDLVVWCLRTLARREPLLADAQNALAWFGSNAAAAIEPAKPGLLARVARVATRTRALG
jgi:hypothetical protein